MKKIVEYEREIKNLRSCCKQFQSQILLLQDQIAYAKKTIPEIRKELERLIKNLPTWEKDLSANRKSLKTHVERLAEKSVLLEKLHRREKLARELKTLEKELR